MFRHDFAETLSNEVVLHESDEDVPLLDRLLLDISYGRVHGQIIFPHSRNRRPEYVAENIHDGYIRMLPLLDKYDCPGLEAQAIRAVTEHVKTLLGPVWSFDDFFTKHYDRITNLCEGVYPKKFYEVFAVAWEVSRRDGNSGDRITAVVEADPALAVFLAGFYCDKLIEAEWRIYELEVGSAVAAT